MMPYKAMFVRVEGLAESGVGMTYILRAFSRRDAEIEALALRRPWNANFIKLVRNGRYEPPKIGFDA